jgi:glutamate-1-semialdehyde 2,1-aminomutase
MSPAAAADCAKNDRIAARAASLLPGEKRQYQQRRPRSCAAHERASEGLINHVPLHWMLDWPMPVPLIVDEAVGAQLTDIDGNRLLDLCLGDTGAMFGHGPEPILRALAGSAQRGLTTMLPSSDAQRVGQLLASRFPMPCWQVAATASDANRFAIRVARAVTGRPRVLVFDGCYHGSVEETLVDLVDGKTLSRRSLLGQVIDGSQTTVSIPFNDEAALRRALAAGDIACVLAEPVMTNCGMILPQPGFHSRLRELTRAAGTLLLIDETHTISTGLGGYTTVHGLEPDIFVLGKPVGGGVPVSVWGLSKDVSRGFALALQSRNSHGHSGIGTTLSGSALQLACLRACLEEVMTQSAYATMLSGAGKIEAALTASIQEAGFPWHVSCVGARIEVVFSRDRVRNASEARAVANPVIEQFIHLALLNRGFLLAPFHNMVLVSPATTAEDCAGFIAAYREVLRQLAQDPS